MDENKRENKILIGMLCGIGGQIIYGFSFLFTKKVTADVDPFALLGWRFLFAFLVINILIKLKVLKLTLKGKNLKPLLLLAFLCPVFYFIGETLGIQRTTAAESSVVIACIPVFGLLASSVILNKKPTKLQAIGVAISITGVIVSMLGKELTASLDILGYILLLSCIIVYGIYASLSEREKDYSSVDKTYVMLGTAAIAFPILAIIRSLQNNNFNELIKLPFTNGFFLIAILYLGIGCSIVAFTFDNISIVNIGANGFSSLIGITTVVSVIASVIILKEPFTGLQIIGVVLVLAGVYIANFNHDNIKS